ncbi:MAG: sigma-70 domain-containing protein [Lachnospira sp.]
MAGKEEQASFLEALNGLKEYAAVNGGIVTKEDINSYFKNIILDDAKTGMITGYLMANNIKVAGEEAAENEFLKLMENALENKNEESEEDDIDEDDKKVADSIQASLNYEEDQKYLEMYLKDLSSIQPMSDTSRAFLLMNIVEDNDKDSLDLLSESYLEKIVLWIEPYRGKGVLACDLVQDANLAMMSYIGQKQWINNLSWKDKIKEGTTEDLLNVMKEMDEEVRSLIGSSLDMLIDEQREINLVSGKVLNKVNLVNDWAVRLKEELGRKPTVSEVAERMGVADDVILEAIQLSAETIEEIEYEKTQKKSR